MSGNWEHGLFGCFGDCGTCILTFLLPCVTAGQNAEKVGKSCCLYGCLSTLGCIGIYTRAVVRGEIRQMKSIEGSFGNDCVCHWFCGVCALVQEAQELKGEAGQCRTDAKEQDMSRE
jgi:Cys-rich protein (TIGR01571 family)